MMRGWGIDGVTAVVAWERDLNDTHTFFFEIILNGRGVMRDESMRGLNIKIFELAGSHSLVPERYGADYSLVLGVRSTIFGLRS